MLNKMKRVAAGLLTAVFLLNISAVPGVNNVTQVEAASLVKKGKGEEYLRAREEGTLDRGMFSPADWEMLNLMMDDFDAFMARFESGM